MVQSVINQVHGLVADTFVVTGAWQQALESAAQRGALSGATTIYCASWQKGLGHSIATGVAKLEPRYDGILVLLGDQVAVTSADIRRLLACLDGHDAACAVYRGRRGAPAVFGKNCFGLLKELTGDRGAKTMLYNPALAVAKCDMPHAAIDIDSRPELLRWLNCSDIAPLL